ncbi:MAG TPA: DNRLRE domain-containing protein [Acidimicrobiia bacterium]|nr:DNRLRE domain-containing protein [Acidimicrobiia bacterium]
MEEDATIISAEPDTAFGDEDGIELELSEDYEERSLIRFDVVGIPEGRLVSRVLLRLVQVDGSSWGGLLSGVNGDWSEDSVTWATAPGLGDPLAPLPANEEGLVEIDITGVVTADGRYDFYLTTEASDDLEYASRESGDGAELVITVAAADQTGVGITRGTVLAGAGDIAGCDSDGDEITATLLDEVAEQAREIVVFTVGDNAYEDGTAANFTDCYEPSWGRHKEITRPAVGTREYRSEGAVPHFEYFGESAGTAGEGWYSYDLGAWHVIVLNSNCDQVGGCDPASPQGQWLEEDLAANPSVCTLAYWHHPVYSSTERGGSEEMAPVFELLFDAGVDVVLNGDNHFYERFEPMDGDGDLDDQGIRQFVVGTGGHSLAGFGPPVTNSVVRYREAFGILVLSLFEDGYRWEFLSEPGVLFSDRGADLCH